MSRIGHLLLPAIVLSLLGCGSGSGTNAGPDRERNRLAITQRTVVVNRRPILTVVRDSTDGRWFFFPDENPGVDPEVTLTLDDIIRIDGSVAQLLDLLPGWKAWRADTTQPWSRRKF